MLAVMASVLISSELSQAVSKEVFKREVSLIFGAIESGPLAIAKLHSSSIAQQELDRLMSLRDLSDRGLISAEIYGGKNFVYKYASWVSGHKAKTRCVLRLQKTYQAQEALNPYEVVLTLDQCHLLQEQKTILKYSSIASLLVAFIAIILIITAVFPAVISIRKAENILSTGAMKKSDHIVFNPINDLVTKALRNLELERRVALVSMATQVSHDIRSPLSTLNMVLATVQNLPSEKVDIIKNAIRRINEIANDLLIKSKANSQNQINADVSVAKVQVIGVIESVLSEKRAEYANHTDLKFTLDADRSTESDAKIERTILARVLSNLLNNSAEGCNFKGTVTVAVRTDNSSISVSILDDGRGIPEEVLTHLGERGMTYGKEGSASSGSGLGIAHAREVIEASGGHFTIHSRFGEGTLVTLRLLRFFT